MAISFDGSHWALILGGSSGFGLATAQKLARHGMNVCVVTTAKTDEEARKLLQLLGMPFRTN